MPMQREAIYTQQSSLPIADMLYDHTVLLPCWVLNRMVAFLNNVTGNMTVGSLTFLNLSVSIPSINSETVRDWRAPWSRKYDTSISLETLN